MMPLTMARPGETVTIRKITGRDEVRQHLAGLGFVVNSDVTVVSQLAGNLILQVKDSRVSWNCWKNVPSLCSERLRITARLFPAISISIQVSYMK